MARIHGFSPWFLKHSGDKSPHSKEITALKEHFVSWRREPLTLESSLAYHTAMQIQTLLLSLLLLRRQTGG